VNTEVINTNKRKIVLLTFNQYLQEKQIIVGKGAKYGQVVFLAGGAGSGKGFATTHFLEGTKFKIRDVDGLKKAFLKIAEMKNKYPEIRGLDPSECAKDKSDQRIVWVRERLRRKL
jgi:hypothetical protein